MKPSSDVARLLSNGRPKRIIYHTWHVMSDDSVVYHNQSQIKPIISFE